MRPDSKHPRGGANGWRAWAMSALAAICMTAVPAQARSEPAQVLAPSCPWLMLLMDFECAQYQQRRIRAGNSEERLSIDREYWQLGEERRESCRCGTGRAARSEWDVPGQDGLACQ